MSFGIYPGTTIAQGGIYNLLNLDPLMRATLRIGGNLDANGAGTFTLTVPPGIFGMVEMYCQGLVIGTGVAKSKPGGPQDPMSPTRR